MVLVGLSLLPVTVFAQSHGPVYDYFYGNTISLVPKVFQLVWAIIMILSIVFGFRIYRKMQMGEEDASSYMYRWGGALLGFFAVTAFMNVYFASDVADNSFHVDSRLFLDIDPIATQPYTPTSVSLTLPTVQPPENLYPTLTPPISTTIGPPQ